MAVGHKELLLPRHVPHKYRVVSDSTSALGVAHRQGQGKIKHLHTRSLWVQQYVRSGEVSLEKVHTDNNIAADIGTKILNPVRIRRLAVMSGTQFDSPLSDSQVVGGLFARKTWCRHDKGKRCYVTTNKHGPPWSAVTCRRTLDARTGALVSVERVREMPTGYNWNGPLPLWVTGTKTVLEYEIAEESRSETGGVHGVVLFPSDSRKHLTIGCVACPDLNVREDVKDEMEEKRCARYPEHQ
eukprot:6489812-Amphidinium_carterae.2